MNGTIPATASQALRQLERLCLALTEARSAKVHPSLRQAAEDGIVSEIGKVQATLFAAMEVRPERPADLVVRVVPQHPGIPGFHSSHLIVPQIDGLRLGIQTVSGYLQRGYITKRPKRELVAACDVGIDWVNGGSVRAGLSLPRPDTTEAKGAHIERAARLVVHALEWTGREGADEEFERTIPDAALRAVVLAEVARIAPAKRGEVQLVEFSGRRMERVARLDRSTGEWIQAAITRLGAAPAEQVEGEVRGVDLDRHMVVLKTSEGRRVRCEFPTEQLHLAVPRERLVVTGRRPITRGRPASVLVVATVTVPPAEDEDDADLDEDTDE